ncbi:MAG: hypothetical protein RJB58_292 [Pseudomonadota bacterium]|jgi:hypothetical protein
MIDHLWQSTLFALVIAAMVPLFRQQSAGIRFWTGAPMWPRTRLLAWRGKFTVR